MEMDENVRDTSVLLVN